MAIPARTNVIPLRPVDNDERPVAREAIERERAEFLDDASLEEKAFLEMEEAYGRSFDRRTRERIKTAFIELELHPNDRRLRQQLLAHDETALAAAQYLQRYVQAFCGSDDGSHSYLMMTDYEGSLRDLLLELEIFQRGLRRDVDHRRTSMAGRPRHDHVDTFIRQVSDALTEAGMPVGSGEGPFARFLRAAYRHMPKNNRPASADALVERSRKPRRRFKQLKSLYKAHLQGKTL